MSTRIVEMLVLAKARPSQSKKYGTLICTAGLTKKGEWIRLYPIPFDTFSFEETNFKIGDIIRVEIQKRPSNEDKRVASYRVLSRESIKIIDRLGTNKKEWRKRSGIFKKKLTLGIKEFQNKEGNIKQSLTIIKPKKITNVRFEAPKKLDDYKKEEERFEKIDGDFVPDEYPFIRILFETQNGCKHDLRNIEWGINELFRNQINKKSLKDAKETVREFILKKQKKYDIYFIMGNGYQYFRWPTQWFIIGWFATPKSCGNYTDLNHFFCV